MDTQEFEQIDINSFLDHTAEDSNAADTNGAFTERQTDLSVQIAQRTMQDLPEMFEEEADALGYIDEAIESARGALDEIGLADLLDEPETERGS